MHNTIHKKSKIQQIYHRPWVKLMIFTTICCKISWVYLLQYITWRTSNCMPQTKTTTSTFWEFRGGQKFLIVIFFSLYVLNEIINVYDLSGVLSHNNAHWYSPLLCWLPEYFTINIVLSRSHKFIQRAKNSLVRVVFISLYLCWAQYHIYDQSMTKFYTIRTTKKHILC